MEAEVQATDMRGFRMGELEKRSGTGKQLIHYYIRKGYLPPPVFKQGNQALYNETHLDRLIFLRTCREKGMPLAYSSHLWESNRSAKGEAGRGPRRAGADLPTRDKIIEAATGVFLRNGYRGTTISEVVESIGLSKASFYYYFENKKDLYFVCLENIFETRFVGALEEIKKETDQTRRLQRRWDATRPFFPEMMTILNLIKESLSDEDEEHRVRAAAILRKSLIEPLQGDLEKGITGGIFRQVEIDIIPFALISVLETFAYHMMVDDRFSDGDIEEAILDFVLHGLLK
jgi:AcrR family transcriptional regulator